MGCPFMTQNQYMYHKHTQKTKKSALLPFFVSKLCSENFHTEQKLSSLCKFKTNPNTNLRENLSKLTITSQLWIEEQSHMSYINIQEIWQKIETFTMNDAEFCLTIILKREKIYTNMLTTTGYFDIYFR